MGTRSRTAAPSSLSEQFNEIATTAIRIESRTNLLFSFEKMALRDAVRTPAGAQAMAEGLCDFLHGRGSDRRRFEDWCAVGNVTRVAAARYGYSFEYQPKPNWSTYSQLLDFVAVVRRDLTDLAPRDMIDMQSFLWVRGSDEYHDRVFRAARTTQVRQM